MTLEEFVLTYRDADGELVVTIANYYDKFIRDLRPEYKRHSFYNSATVLCCFHGDVNPSLGTIRHKYLKDVRVYHCFGCGASGTVIRMHQRVQKEFYHRDISERESALELCELYGIDASQYKQDTVSNSSFVEKMKRIDKAVKGYSLTEFHEELLPARDLSLSIEERIRLASSCYVKMVATKKKLFD